jgi:hypothetical protein
MRWAGDAACMREECIERFERKTSRKEITRKIYT